MPSLGIFGPQEDSVLHFSNSKHLKHFGIIGKSVFWTGRLVQCRPTILNGPRPPGIALKHQGNPARYHRPSAALPLDRASCHAQHYADRPPPTCAPATLSSPMASTRRTEPLALARSLARSAVPVESPRSSARCCAGRSRRRLPRQATGCGRARVPV
jgi:hypothetical protein